MSTGVDAQTCKLIVLDRRIASMTEFKQIIGRGTRIQEDYGKLFFTIMDFRQATALFADPDFDGDPVQIYEPQEGQSVVPPEDRTEDPPTASPGEVWAGLADGEGVMVSDDITPYRIGGDATPERTHYVVDNVEVRVATERVQYLDESGKLFTESLRDYTRKAVLSEYASLDAFLTVWSDAERKQALLEELAEKGVFIDELAESVGRDYDAFDLICHVAFDQPPLTRRERAENVKKRNVFAKYGDQVRAILDALLQKYADAGITSVESMEILKVDPLTAFGTPIEIVKLFGDKAAYPATPTAPTSLSTHSVC